jgi:pimeloyl-ACP methyl ester carboxylesterase
VQNRVIPERSFTLVGHSYAGYLARGIIYHRRQTVDGLLLLVPWITYDPKQRSVPEKVTLTEDAALLAGLDPGEAAAAPLGRANLVCTSTSTPKRKSCPFS